MLELYRENLTAEWIYAVVRYKRHRRGEKQHHINSRFLHYKASADSSVGFLLRLLLFSSFQPGQPLVHLGGGTTCLVMVNSTALPI